MFSATHVDFELPIQRLPQAGTYRGREQVQSLFQDYLTAFDNLVL